MNEIQIITDENVSIESLSEEAQHSFYMEMLVKILELHRQKEKCPENSGRFFIWDFDAKHQYFRTLSLSISEWEMRT